MSGLKQNPKEDLKSFLEKLGESVDSNRAKQAADRVLNSLRAQYRGQDSIVITLPEQIAPRAKRSWVAAAVAAIVLIASAVLLQFTFVRNDSSAVAEIVDGGVEVLNRGIPISNYAGSIRADQTIRTADNNGAVIRLHDGSRVELSANLELSVHPVADGTEIRLVDGSVIVSAVKQTGGHLYVVTKDCTVSVVGTVFSVSTRTTGSRVSVIQGEVKVNLGEETRLLSPGEQMATNPFVEIVPVPIELQWSRNVLAHLALLQQALPVISPVVQPQDSRGVVRGTVRRLQSQEGISDVAITVCQGSELTSGGTGYWPQVLPARENVGEIYIRYADWTTSVRGTLESLVELRDKLGKLVISPVVCKNPLSAMTDLAGHFVIRDVPPGEYTVRAQREGYFGPERSGRWQQNFALPLVVAADQSAADISLYLIPGGAISGRVRDNNGQPLVDATVQAYEVSGTDANAVLRIVAGRQSDDRGEYRLFGLPPGEYYVAVNPAVTYAADGVPQPQRTYYPGRMDASGAALVSVRSGEETPRIDIDLRTAPLVKISGTLVGIAGTTNMNLSLLARDLQPETSRTLRTSGARQSFTFSVPPGSYDLVATGNCQAATVSNTGPTLYFQSLATGRGCIGIASIDVRDRDVDGISLNLSPKVDLSGRVTVNATSVRNGDIQVALDAQSQAARRNYSRLFVSADPNGGFVIAGVPPGRFKPAVRLSGQLQDYYVVDIRLGGVSVMTNGIEAGITPPSSPLEIVLNSGGGTVSGVVRGAGQKAVSHSFVVLVPSGPRSQNLSLYPVATADENGRFTIRGIAPGEYKLFAWRDDAVDLYSNAAALQRFEVFARSVSVAPASNIANLQIDVVPDMFPK